MNSKVGSIALSCLVALGTLTLLAHFSVLGLSAQDLMATPLGTDRAAWDEGRQETPSGPIFDAWTPRAAMPTGRAAPAAAVLNGKIYLVGGWQDGTLATNEAYDPASDSWQTRAAMSVSRNALAAAAVNGRVYAIGGWNSSTMSVTAAVEAYNPGTDSWKTVSPLPFPRNALAAAVVGGQVYAIGGWDGRGVTDTVTAYNPADNTWRLRAPMPTARNGLAAVVVQGKIYAIGGYDGLSVTGKVEIYDPVTNSWSTGADMPTPRWLLGAAAVDDQIYVVGGNDDGSFGASLSTNEQYDVGAGTWRTVSAMPTGRWGLTASAFGRRLYAIGGSGDTTTNEMYVLPASHRVYLPLIFPSSTTPADNVSRPRFHIFILNPVRTCLVGNDFASGSVCRGPKCGDCDCAWEDFDPPAPLLGVDPERVNDPQYAGYEHKVCVEVRLTQAEVNDIISDMQLVRDQVYEWSGGTLDLQLKFTVLAHDHVGFVAPEFVFGPFEVDDELLNPYVTAKDDFVYVVTGVYDRTQDVHLAYACGGSYGEMSVRGAGYANIQVHEFCNSVTIAGQRVYEPLIHEWMHNMDWALYYINQVPDIYQLVGPDWQNWEPGPWPACGTGSANADWWFPSVDLCEWDPDWIDCNNEASAGACLHAGEVGDHISWYEHVISAHYPRFVNYIGNHCRDGRQDFSETGLDSGGPCP